MAHAMTPTHEQVLAAIDKARPPLETSNFTNAPAFHARNAHCDDLRELVTFHHPNGGKPCGTCLVADGYTSCLVYRIVVERLTGWGVL
jgi:hypothetical protein